MYEPLRFTQNVLLNVYHLYIKSGNTFFFYTDLQMAVLPIDVLLSKCSALFLNMPKYPHTHTYALFSRYG